MEHIHISALNTVIVVLSVIVVLGTLNLVAERYKESHSLAASWLALMSPTL